MQLRYDTQLSVEEYVSTEAWREAKLAACPNHARGGCGLARHGTYTRHSPVGAARIARWYCPRSHMTFSLLPDCFCARLPGTLDQLEAVAVAIECGGATLPSVCAIHEHGSELNDSAAYRWLRCRLQALSRCLKVLITLYPDLFAGCAPTVTAMRAALGVETRLLMRCRQVAAGQLAHISPPLGFAHIHSHLKPP